MVDQIKNPTDSVTNNTLFQNNPVASNLSDLTNGILGGGRAYFPVDLDKQKIWMSFSFYQYQRPQFNNTAKLADQGTVRLPVPNNLVDTSSMEYTQEALGSVAGAALNAMSGGKTLGGVGGSALKGLGLSAAGKLADLANAPLGLTGATATGSQILGQELGVAVNPFLTVMFKQPSFKRHAFLWRLTPSNVEESNALNTIIKAFKFNQLPDLAESMGGTLLTYPNIVQVTLSNFNENFFSYALKPAVIETLSVNYAPSSTPSFFGATKSPTEIEIRMTLLEITMWLQRDYGKPNTSGLDVFGSIADRASSLGNAFTSAAAAQFPAQET